MLRRFAAHRSAESNSSHNAKRRDSSELGEDDSPHDSSEHNGRRSEELQRGLSDLSEGSGSGSLLSRGSALRRGMSFAPWLGGDYFLCINVKEGVDLTTGINMRGATCDPFVRVALQRPGALALAEAETRVLTRNRFPLWEECLPFPLDDVTEDVSVVLRVLDKDIGHFNSFIGSVSLPIQFVLTKITELGQEHTYRMPLLDRSGKETRRGTLVFGVSILQKQQYKELRGRISAIQDPDSVHAELGDHRLHMRLHGLREAGGLAAAAGGGLAVEVSLCSFEERKPLVLRAGPGGAGEGGCVEVEGGDLAVPLGAAFAEGGALRGKSRAQFGEIKIELMWNKVRLAKTQIPIWDVPFRPEAPPPPPTPPSPPAAAAAAAAADSPDPSERAGRGLLGSIANAMAGAAAAGVAVARGKSEAAAEDAPPPGSPRPATPPAPAPAPPPAPAPAPLWEGRRYERRMELDKGKERGLAGPPLLLLSMQLVKADVSPDGDASGAAATAGGGATGSGAAAATDLNAEDVESPAAPLAAPPPLPTPVCDYVVCMGPHALFRALFVDGSEVADRVAAAEKVADLRSEPWTADPEGRALLMRAQSCKKPTPVGPTNVDAIHKLLAKCDGGWVLEKRITPAVPGAGQCVHVFMQVVAQHVGPGRTRLTVTMRTEWFKSSLTIKVLKGQVEDASPKDARKWYATVRKELAAKVGVEDADGASGAAAAASGGAAAAAGAAAAGPAAADAAAGGASGAAGGGLLGAGAGGGPVALGVLAAVALLLFFVLLALMRVGSALGRSAAALEAVSRALAAAQAAGQQACAAAAAPATALAAPR